MRKSLVIVAIIVSVLVSGCSLLEGVNHSLEYANKAMEHINIWNDFGQRAPQLIQDAATSPEARAQLEKELTALLQEIEEFNQTKPPAIAESIHQQIVDKNLAIKEVIENALVNGELAVDQLEQLQNSGLFKLIQEISKLTSLIENLGL